MPLFSGFRLKKANSRSIKINGEMEDEITIQLSSSSTKDNIVASLNKDLVINSTLRSKI